MDKSLLRDALDGALPALPPVGAPGFLLTALAYEASVSDSRADPRIVALLHALKSDPELRIFDGLMQVILGGAGRFEYYTLANWLLSRAASVGSAQAVEDLGRYLAISELPCELTVVFSGLTPESSCDLGRGVVVQTWDALRDSPQKGSLFRRFAGWGPFHFPTGAVTREFSAQVRHLPEEQVKFALTEHAELLDQTELQDALMCLAIVGPAAPQVVGSWVSLPDWAPTFIGGMALPALEGFSSTWNASADACLLARDLFAEFCALPQELRLRLRLVMQRLNRAMRRGMPVDASIDLGIALEALFLSDLADDRGEPTLRLRIRAARFLGTTIGERKKLFDLVGDLYAIRSSAVHSGDVNPRRKGIPVQEFLQAGFSLVANATRRFIHEGQPNWDHVILG